MSAGISGLQFARRVAATGCLVALLAVSLLGARGASAGPSPSVTGEPCGSAKSVATEVVAITTSMSSPGLALLRPETTGNFDWFSVGLPASLVPGARHRYKNYVSYSPRKLFAFKRRIGVLPVRMGAILIARVGQVERDGARYSDFSYSGKVLGRARWRRALQMSGKGAINCDGTIRIWSMVIRGGSTPISRTADKCRNRRVVATTGGARVCRS